VLTFVIVIYLNYVIVSYRILSEYQTQAFTSVSSNSLWLLNQYTEKTIYY